MMLADAGPLSLHVRYSEIRQCAFSMRSRTRNEVSRLLLTQSSDLAILLVCATMLNDGSCSMPLVECSNACTSSKHDGE